MKTKNSNLVTKIALIVAIVALVFSIVTLVRAIIIRTGIPLAIVQVIGTAIIVAVCSIMLYVLRTNEEIEEDDDEDGADEDTLPEDTEQTQTDADEFDIDVELNDIDNTPSNDKYDLSNFE